MEFDVVAEHAEQMFLEAHHQRMHPGIEDDVRAFEAHLRRVARREVLHVHRRRDHGAGHAEPLGDVAPSACRAQFGLQFRDLGFDLEVVVGDERLDAVERGGLAHLAGEFAAVGAEADDLEAEFRRATRAAAMTCVASPKMKTRLPLR